LSRESGQTERQNVIKIGSRQGKLRIIDYRSVLEEVAADQTDEVKVDVDEIVGSIDKGGAAIEGGFGTGDGHDEAKKAATDAFEQGFEAGKAEASKALGDEYEKKVAELSDDFASITRKFAAEAARYDQDFDKAVVTLAIAIARRIVAREIEVDEGAVLARSREAIRKIIGVDKIKIHVNPADEEYIREHRNELSDYADSVKEIVIESDNKVERGGCVIESELGNIDARVSTQFELIQEALLGLIK